MPALSPNILHPDQPRRASLDPVTQPDNHNCCLSYRLCPKPGVSTTTATLTTGARHSRAPPPSVIFIPVISTATYVATTLTTTSFALTTS
ncbi:hypothetical protein SprV_0301253600 [Sparganum proliferum]